MVAAHWVEVDGIALPKPIGGHPATDFCNTWAGWAEVPPPGAGDPRREWLRGYDVLAVWARHAGLVSEDRTAELLAAAEQDPTTADAVLEEARRLRTTVHDALLAPADPSTLAAFAPYAQAASAASVLTAGERAARWELDPATGLDLPVLAVARAAADLLTSPAAATVAACPGPDCGWLFLDRRGRRRWCDMAACGNRAKVAAHARRQAAQRPHRSG